MFPAACASLHSCQLIMHMMDNIVANHGSCEGSMAMEGEGRGRGDKSGIKNASRVERETVKGVRDRERK